MSIGSVIKPTFLPSQNPQTFFRTNRIFNTESPLLPNAKLFRRAAFSTVKSSSNGSPEKSFNLKDALNDAVDERVEELLNREENKALLDGLEKASLRVEAAKRELVEIERQELEAKQMRAYIDQLEQRASEIAESQKEISEARAMVEEAERSLSQGSDQTGGEGEEVVIKNEERLESIKAASIATIVGTLAGLPVSLSQVSNTTQLIMPIAVTAASCALFGITYRYIIRRDLDDVHLKSGAWAAFGIVAGLGTLSGGPPLELNTESLVSHAFDGGIYVSQNLLVFVSAALSLDYCFKAGLLSPFPIRRSTSRTTDR